MVFAVTCCKSFGDSTNDPSTLKGRACFQKDLILSNPANQAIGINGALAEKSTYPTAISSMFGIMANNGFCYARSRERSRKTVNEEHEPGTTLNVPCRLVRALDVTW